MCLPSASNILGMSRYFSATSKALFRLVTGSSWEKRKNLVRGRSRSTWEQSWPGGEAFWEGAGLERVLEAVLSPPTLRWGMELGTHKMESIPTQRKASGNLCGANCQRFLHRKHRCVFSYTFQLSRPQIKTSVLKTWKWGPDHALGG